MKYSEIQHATENSNPRGSKLLFAEVAFRRVNKGALQHGLKVSEETEPALLPSLKELVKVAEEGGPALLPSPWELEEEIMRLSQSQLPNLGLSFSYAQALEATKSFSSDLIIREDRFGKVYKGVLHDGERVAVRILACQIGLFNDPEEISSKLADFCQIRHSRIVSLIGYCYEWPDMVLVNEYMEQGTLKDQLYDGNWERHTLQFKLSWEQRLQICIDSAEAIHYLHTGWRRRVIHQDISSSSILLAENFRAKVLNFGLRESPYLVHHYGSIADTLGYEDPEGYKTSLLTEKSDVYSFGVLLLEVLCARPAFIRSNIFKEQRLAEWGTLLHQFGELETIIDPFLAGKIHPASFKLYCDTAVKCLKEDTDERPVMREVLWNLDLALDLQQNCNV